MPLALIPNANLDTFFIYQLPHNYPVTERLSFKCHEQYCPGRLQFSTADGCNRDDLLNNHLRVYIPETEQTHTPPLRAHPILVQRVPAHILME